MVGTACAMSVECLTSMRRHMYATYTYVYIYIHRSVFASERMRSTASRAHDFCVEFVGSAAVVAERMGGGWHTWAHTHTHPAHMTAGDLCVLTCCVGAPEHCMLNLHI